MNHQSTGWPFSSSAETFSLGPPVLVVQLPSRDLIGVAARFEHERRYSLRKAINLRYVLRLAGREELGDRFDHVVALADHCLNLGECLALNRGFILRDRVAHLFEVAAGLVESTSMGIGISAKLPVVVHTSRFVGSVFGRRARSEGRVDACSLPLRLNGELALVKHRELGLAAMESAKHSHLQESIIPVLDALRNHRAVFLSGVDPEEIGGYALSGGNQIFVSLRGTGAEDSDDDFV